jgi:HEAT repeat protein
MTGIPTIVILLLTQLLALVIALLMVTAVVIRAARQRLEARRTVADARAAQLIIKALDGETEAVDAVLGRSGLGRRLDAAIVALVPKLRGADREVLVDVLHRRGTIEAAGRGTRSTRAIRRLRSVELLGALGLAETLPDLTPRLADRNPDVRRAAVRGVGRTASAEAVPALLDILERPDRRVAEHGVTLALVRLGPAAVPALTSALTDGGPRARSAAAQVLGWLGDSHAVPALSAVLDGDSHEHAIHAIEALGRMDSPAAAEPLRARLRAHEPPHVRTAAARALGRLGHPASVEALAELLREEHDLAHAAAVSLSQLGPGGRQALEACADTVPEAQEALAPREPVFAAGAR